MSQKQKLLQKFLQSPTSLHYRDIENILIFLGFEIIPAKGSHKKYKHPHLEHDLIIPVHNNDCKNFYKAYICKIIKRHLL